MPLRAGGRRVVVKGAVSSAGGSASGVTSSGKDSGAAASSIVPASALAVAEGLVPSATSAVGPARRVRAIKACFIAP